MGTASLMVDNTNSDSVVLTSAFWDKFWQLLEAKDTDRRLPHTFVAHLFAVVSSVQDALIMVCR